MVKHKDLTGVELHGSRVLLEAPSRLPGYTGEVLYHGGQMWVSTGLGIEDWAASSPPPPPVFSWVLSVEQYQPSASAAISAIELYWLDIDRTEVEDNGEEFYKLETWILGEDLAVGCPVSITQHIQRRGIGCYIFALFGADAYGNALAPLEDSQLFVQSISDPAALQLFRMEGDLITVDTQTHSRPYGFQVVVPLAQVLIRLGNQI